MTKRKFKLNLLKTSIGCFFLPFLMFSFTSDISGQSELRVSDRIDEPGIEEAVHEFRISVEDEIQKLNNGDYGYTKEENTVRRDFLRLALREAANGHEAKSALKRSASIIKQKVEQNSRVQNVDLKNIFQEYSNQFS